MSEGGKVLWKFLCARPQSNANVLQLKQSSTTKGICYFGLFGSWQAKRKSVNLCNYTDLAHTFDDVPIFNLINNTLQKIYIHLFFNWIGNTVEFRCKDMKESS